MAYVPLHLHSEYSLLDGAIRFPSLMARARELDLPALALTDHGNLSGAVEFHNACRKAGIQPILGCEMYVAPGGRSERRSTHGLADAAYHLVLLAENLEGYRNLVQLSSIGYLQGFYYRPRIDKEVLRRHSRGLIGLSGCLKGEVPMLLQKKEWEPALQAVREFQQILGGDHFFLEMQDHGIPAQGEVNRDLERLSEESGAPLVATNDSHYLTPEEAEAHDVLLCIQTNSSVDDPRRMRFEGREFYLKGEEEMRRLFAARPEAVDNTVRVAARCKVELPGGRLLMPGYRVPGDPGPAPDTPAASSPAAMDAYLEKLCREALSRRYPGEAEAARARLEGELEVIRKAGFSGYFLIVWDFIRFARSRGIRVGPGRGSAAGSLVAYLLGITGLDPLKYGLLFERFLNPERLTPPDIDVDFADDRRDEVIAYVVEKYGQEQVAQIITFGTLGAKQAIRDVGRALDYSFGEVDAVARLVPQEPDMTLQRALRESPELARAASEPENPRLHRLVRLARGLEGLARHASTHAAGVVISPDPLILHVPLCTARPDFAPPPGSDPGAAAPARSVVTQYDMESLEKIGLVKMDFLGLRTLTVIDATLRLLSESRGIDLDLDSLPLDDPETYAMLSRGESHGVFQFESAGMRDLLKRFQPARLEDLAALNALYRPGAMGNIDEYLRRRRGLGAEEPVLPQLRGLLAETHGFIVYQEQVMQIAQRVGGFSPGKADGLRRAMSKKDPEAIEAQREAFLQGAAANKVGREAAENLFEQLVKFGGYGFNKSHSAAYALVAFQTAYLKAHHPAEFLCALLSSESGNADKVVATMAECRRLRLAVLPPDVNESGSRFLLSPQGIRFGLSAVKNVGDLHVQSILRSRQEGPFRSLSDFLQRAGQVPRNAVESLIKAGAMDRLPEAEGPRAQMVGWLPTLAQRAQSSAQDRLSGQFSLFDSMRDAAASQDGSLEKVPDWPENVKLGFEKEMLGFYVSGHPLARFESELRALCGRGLGGLKDMKEGQACVVGGLVLGVKHQLTKRKEGMARLTLEDLEGFCEVLVWPRVLARQGAKAVKDALLVVKGRVDLSGESPKVSAEELLTLEEALAALPKALRLRPRHFDPEPLKELRDLLLKHPGPTEVYLNLQQGQRELVQRLGSGFRVRVSRELLASLRAAGLDGWRLDLA